MPVVSESLQEQSVIGSLEGCHVPELERNAIHPEAAPALIGQIELIHREALQEIIDILQSKEIQALIEQGKLTIGIIKPRVDEAALESQLEHVEEVNDVALAEKIMGEIQPPLQIVFHISYTEDEKFIDNFYGGNPRTFQKQFPPMKQNRYGEHLETRWDEFVALMKRGPTTWMLLYEPGGDAVKEWRRQMGETWNVEQLQAENSTSLRAQWAKDNHNNILHGSDSVVSVKTELALLTYALSGLL